MLIERIEPDFSFEDERGSLVQLVRRGYSQVNVITSRGGTSRGGHYHALNTEAFYVVRGRCRVVASRGSQVDEAMFGAGDFFRVGPFAEHSFSFPEDTVLVSMYSLGVELDDGSKDIHVTDGSAQGREEARENE